MDKDLKIIVREESRDRHARATQTKIGKKVISTPNFCTQLKDSDELDLFLRMKAEYPSDNLSTTSVCFVDLEIPIKAQKTV